MSITTINFGIGGSGTSNYGIAMASKSDIDEMSGGGIDVDANNQPIPASMEGALTDEKINSMGSFPVDTKLSPNFTIRELCVGNSGNPNHNTKVRNGLPYTEKEIVIGLRNLAVNVLEPLVKAFGGKNAFTITSGHRNSNTWKAGAGTSSQHFHGQAVDLVFRSGNPVANATKIAQTLENWSQLIMEYQNSCVIHIGYGNHSSSIRYNTKEIFSCKGDGRNNIWKNNGLCNASGKQLVTAPSLGGKNKYA